MKWCPPPVAREQLLLFSTCVDDAIPADHRVRVIDLILRELDWSQFEARYSDNRGQPAIHPRIVAGLILYGHMVRVRSSRALEAALKERFDFFWLAEGRTIDHTTISEFRRTSGSLLGDIGAQMAVEAHQMGVTTLMQLGQDGTRLRASNSRRSCANVKDLDELEQQFRQTIEELEQKVKSQDQAAEDSGEARRQANRVRKDLASAQNRAAALKKAKEEIERARAAKEPIPNQVPLTDPESRITPNKTAGYDANFTPVATVDLESGLILDGDVRPNTDEEVCLVPSVQRVESQLFDRGLSVHVESVTVDSRFVDGENLKALDDRGTLLYGPIAQIPDFVQRADGRQPIAEEYRDQLPKHVVRRAKDGHPAQLQLTKEAFLYDEQQNCHWCPTGQPLRYTGTSREKKRRHGRETIVIRQRYAASADACSCCPLKNVCLQGPPKKNTGRTLSRDDFETHRDQLRERMARPENTERIRKRQTEGERPFAVIKHVFGIRQFLLRGLENVRVEWKWITNSVNLMILARLRTTLAATRGSGGRDFPGLAGA